MDDLPCTQAMDEEILSTQAIVEEERQEDVVVGTVVVENKSYQVLSGVTTIGRHPKSKIYINDETVSKAHAKIEADSADGSIFIEDLKSCNKTKINNTNLKPNANYQLKDGDKLTFGRIDAIFKVFNSLENSLDPHIPQNNREAEPIIPDTPDTSANVSSDFDVSAIPGTQTDTTDDCFRRPQLPTRMSSNTTPKSPKVVKSLFDELPSPLSNTKRQNVSSEAETERYSSDSREDFDDSIYDAETQKPVPVKSEDSDEIYEMETQRPTDLVEMKKEIFQEMETDTDMNVSRKSVGKETQKYKLEKLVENEENIETQSKTESRKSNASNRKSINLIDFNASDRKSMNFIDFDASVSLHDLNESIHTAETQKCESVENMETQRFESNNISNLNRKSLDVSIYSAETQRSEPEGSEKSIENMETQQFGSRKSIDVSIYSAETQKCTLEESANEAIENMETQQFESKKLNLKSPKSSVYTAGDTRRSDGIRRKSVNSSLSKSRKSEHDQSANEFFQDLETEQFEEVESNNIESDSIYDAETQKVTHDTDVAQSLVNVETQKFDTRKSNLMQTPRSKRMSIKKVHFDVSRNDKANTSGLTSLDDMDTQRFNCDKSNVSNRVSLNKSASNNIPEQTELIENLETQQFSKDKEPKSFNGSLKNVSTGSPMRRKSVDLKTPASVKRMSMNISLHNSEPNVSEVDESIGDLETQQFTNDRRSEINNISVQNTSLHSLKQRQSIIPETPSSAKRLSMDKSLHNTEQNVSVVDESIEDLETQQFTNDRRSEINNRSVQNTSLHSLKQRQSIIPETPLSAKRLSMDKSLHNTEQNVSIVDESIEDLETQQFTNDRRSEINNRSVQNTSLHSLKQRQSIIPETPLSAKRLSMDKSLHNTEQNVSIVDESIEDLETQQFTNDRRSEINNRSVQNTSLHSLKQRQSIIPETPLSAKRLNMDKSLHNTEQNVSIVDESIENLETQQFTNDRRSEINRSVQNISLHSLKQRQSVGPQTPASSKRMSRNKSLGKTEQSESSVNENIEDLETQQFANSGNKSMQNVSLQSLRSRKSINSQTPVTVKEMSVECVDERAALHKAEQNASVANESIVDSETQQFSKHRRSKIINESLQDISSQSLKQKQAINPPTPASTKRISINESVNESETEEFVLKINADESIDDLQTQQFTSKNASTVINETVENIESQDLKNHDSGISTSLLVLNMETTDRSGQDESENNGKDFQKPLKSVDNKIDHTITAIDDKQSKIQIEEDGNNENDDDDEDEDMFYSQNLISECPFPYMPEESQTNDAERNMYDGNCSSRKSVCENGDVHSKSLSFANLDNKNTSNTIKSLVKNQITEEIDSDAETDEEGVFSHHSPKVNTNITAEDGSETDEEGVFSSYVSSEKEKDKSTGKYNIVGINKNSTVENTADSETDDDLFKPEDLPSKKIESVDQKISTSDSEDNLFDDNSDEKNDNGSKSCKRTSAVHDGSISKANVSTLEQNIEASENEIHDAPTQVMSVNQSPSARKSRIEDAYGLLPTQIVDTRKISSSDEDAEDDFLATTQVVKNRKSQIHNRNSEDISSAPTQVISTEEDAANEIPDDFDLQPTQKIVDMKLAHTQVIGRQLSGDCTKIDNIQNASIENLDYETAPTQVIEDHDEPRSSRSMSKRQLEEIEITSSKKLKKNESKNSKIDLDSTIEKNLDEMFEGHEEKSVENQSILLTQQLANILESSQIENSPEADPNSSVRSPTLGSKRSQAKGKNRKKGTLHNKSILSTKSEKSSANLDDTIERNLHELFDNSVNTEESYQPDSMMTQQIKDVLQSQEDNQDSGDATSPLKKSSPERKKSRLNHSVDMNEPQQSRSQPNENASGNDEKTISRRGTIGFSNDLKPISTAERMSFPLTKSMSFTSDSQSDNDALTNSPRSIGRKRFNLSLSKSVNLNSSSQSSSSERENVGKNLTTPKKIGNQSREKQQSLPRIPEKRVLNRGIRGFDSSRKEVESDELVSAASTESDESRQPTPKKVCTTPSLRSLDISRPSIRDSPVIESDVDDDEEDDFLKNLPKIKVAGTVDCPPTDSQLAAPSDHEDEIIIDSQPVEIPSRWNLYATRRFDRVYQQNREKVTETSTEKEENPRSDHNKLPIPTVDDILAEIEKTGKTPKPRRQFSGNSSDSDSSEDKKVESARSTRARRYSTRKLSSPEQSTSKLVVQSDVVKNKLTESISGPANEASSSDSDSDDDSETLLPKYKPLPKEKFDLQALLKQGLEDNSDEEFVEMGGFFERMIGQPSPNCDKVSTSRLDKFGASPSPSMLRRRKKRASQELNTSLNVTRTRSTSSRTNKKNTDSPQTQKVAKDASVFQVSEVDDCSKTKTPTATTSRMSGLTIIRNKRSRSAQKDVQNHPGTKRTKAEVAKLQGVTVIISPLREKLTPNRRAALDNKMNALKQNADARLPQNRIFKLPKSLQSKENLLLDDSDSKNVPQKTRTQNTRSKKNEDTKAVVVESVKRNPTQTRTRTGRNLKKELTVEVPVKNSNESQNQKNHKESSETKKTQTTDDTLYQIKTLQNTRSRGGRAKRNETDSSAKESKSEITDNKLKSTARNTRGMASRKKQLESETGKEIDRTIILDSDSEPELVQKETRSKKIKNSKSSNSEKLLTEKSTNIGRTCTRKKQLESETGKEIERTILDSDSEPELVQKETRSKEIKNSKSSNSEKSIKIGRTCTRRFQSNKDSTPELSQDRKQEKVIPRSTRTKGARVEKIAEKEKTKGSEDSGVSTRSKREKIRDPSVDSIFSEPENKKICSSVSTSKSASSRPTRQKRKRLESPDLSAVEASTESQEVAEILKNVVEEDNFTSSRGRRGRRIIISDSEDSHESTIHKILFIGDETETQRKMIKELGGSEVEDSEECTILVTDKVTRSPEFLCCLARGIPIVSSKWLTSSKKANRFLDWEEYILKDSKTETKFKFKLRESLEKVKKHKFLTGYTVFLTPNITQLPVSELKEMIIHSGGKPIFKAPTRWATKTVIIAEEKDLDNIKKYMTKAPKTVATYSVDFVLTGILRQKIDLHEFKLTV